MKNNARPAMLPADASDQPARLGRPLVSRTVHTATCGLRRGDECTCVPRMVDVREAYARRFEES